MKPMPTKPLFGCLFDCDGSGFIDPRTLHNEAGVVVNVTVGRGVVIGQLVVCVDVKDESKI